MLLTIAERFRDALVPFLIVGTAILLLLFIILIGQRLFREAAWNRRQSLLERYRPLVDEALASDSPAALDAVRSIPRSHRAVAAQLVLATVRIVKGAHNERARLVAEQLQLTPQWRDDLGSRLWWRRSEAALALGLLRDRESAPLLIGLLDDDHEQVRAAAIDALGMIGDASTLAPLLARLDNPWRHERARMVQALRAFGEDASRALVEHGARHERDRATVATVLSYVGGAGANASLVEWSKAEDAPTRAAVWSAFAAIGLDDRAFYHAIKALHADEVAVRSAAARALARSGREDAVPQLALRLDDEWEVAAEAARALARIGKPGIAALQQRLSGGDGLGRELARQVLWEGGHR